MSEWLGCQQWILPRPNQTPNYKPAKPFTKKTKDASKCVNSVPQICGGMFGQNQERQRNLFFVSAGCRRWAMSAKAGSLMLLQPAWSFLSSSGMLTKLRIAAPQAANVNAWSVHSVMPSYNRCKFPVNILMPPAQWSINFQTPRAEHYTCNTSAQLFWT